MGKTKTQFVGESLDETKQKSKKPKKKEKVHLSGQKGGERVKLMEGNILTKPASTSLDTGASARQGKPKVRGKKYIEAKRKVDSTKVYPLKDAITLAKETSTSKFDGTMELHLVTRKSGLAASVELPHSSGKTRKVEIADEQTIKKLESGKVDFDVLLATPDMMPRLVPHARLLGPRGLMPNPKNGTIIKTKKDAEKFNADKVTIKTEKSAPVVHTVVGKVSMKEGDLLENIESILNVIGKKQVLKAYLTTSMGPSVKVSVE